MFPKKKISHSQKRTTFEPLGKEALGSLVEMMLRVKPTRAIAVVPEVEFVSKSYFLGAPKKYWQLP